jgi:GntR family phosphonate transport system transcriptional regulator
LKIRAGARIIRIDTLGRANGRPISLGVHYFPARRVESIGEIFPKLRSVTKSLQQLGIEDYKRVSTRVTARLPTAEEAHRLRMAKTQPLLVTEGINVESGGRPIEYALGLFASDRVQLVVGDT